MTRAPTSSALLAASLIVACEPRAGSIARQAASRNRGDSASVSFVRQLSEEDGETVGLLSAKYELDAVIVRNLINGYRRQYDVVYRILAETTGADVDSSMIASVMNPQPPAVIGTVAKLADAYHVPRQKVASLLWDYRLLKSAAEAPTDK